MIDILKDILGISGISDYDVYLVVIGAVGIVWIAKTVINGIYDTVLHIFK